ncbi:hypothetical protein KM043_005788 [Ampulex compressa]|nr:hypothetical protein KM043_005788 [Ampulex compressa]
MYKLTASCSKDHVKKKCPYMEKCYRKNPIHFNEMSHPHLEKLVINQLVGTIEIPEVLDFECADRSLLLDQLKVLQMVLRTARDKNKENAVSEEKDEVSKCKAVLADASGAKQGIDDDLKAKVDRHKQASMARRENKLQEMDDKAEELFKASTSKGESDSSGGKKRSYENSGDDRSMDRKAKSGRKEEENSSSSGGSSIIDVYSLCKSGKSREDVRRRAIEMMKHHGFQVSVVEPGDFALKFALSAPYHYFLTRIQNSKPTYDQQFTVTFPEILDKSLGEIVFSLHMNFMVDVGWLCLQYLLAGQSAEMLIFYGDRVDEEKVGLNITLVPVNMPSEFGCHHSKIMVLKYKDGGIRIVISTANLYSDDWENRTQGLWMSPHLPPLPESVSPFSGESPTGFKRDFEKYLCKYNHPALTEWIYLLRRADLSSVNVFFLGSVPGIHKGVETNLWGHRKLASVLSKYATLPPDAPQWPIVAQSSSIGSLGPKYDSWLSKEIVSTMSREITNGLKSQPNFKFIYPSINNFKHSFDCRNASCCLPYSIQTHSKQCWIEPYLCQWKATRTARDKAMPHIKSYTRFSPDMKKIPWFVLTSANLSKAAWGNTRASYYIASYEAGVVFIPKIITGTTTFPVIEEETAGIPVFPIPYDLPLTRYDPQDKPFVVEFFNDAE